MQRSWGGNHSRVGVNGQKRILLLAARQPEVSALLEDAGFEVDTRRGPLSGEIPHADVAVVFRGRLIGRNQAAILNSKGVRVIEVLMSEPTSPSTHDWLRLSHRIPKSDLVQIIRSVADGAE